MPYGHPVSSGHGRRAPAYQWSPSVRPPAERRPRRRPAEPDVPAATLLGRAATSLAGGVLETARDMAASRVRRTDAAARLLS